MKIGPRETGLLAIGFVIGAFVAALLSTAAILVIQSARSQTANQPDATMERSLDTLLAAIAANNHQQFVAIADDAFGRHLTAKAFQSISESLGKRVQGGCTPVYLGQFQQTGSRVSLWRLEFADGGDDRLARLSMAQDRVTGFLVTPAF